VAPRQRKATSDLDDSRPGQIAIPSGTGALCPGSLVRVQGRVQDVHGPVHAGMGAAHGVEHAE